MTSNTSDIRGFRDTYAFMSNFYGAPVMYNGIRYVNSENAYQAQKEPARATDFTNLQPNQSKKLGRTLNIRKDWDAVKLQIMYEIVRAKFTQNKPLARQLLRTGQRNIIEENYWNDTYWGVCRGTGENHLGKILMRVRSELQEQELHLN